MVSKGNKNCCCEGCYHRAHYRSLGSDDIQEMQQYCCACLPKSICVTASCAGGHSHTVVFDWACPASPGDPVYSGSIPIEGSQIDLAFQFSVVDGVCYFCISSSALSVYGEPPGDCYVVDATLRSHPDHFCVSLLKDGQPVTWTFANGCTTGDLTIAISAADNTPITNRPQYCQDYATGAMVQDTDPIRDLCCNCSCICECACITTYGDDVAVTPLSEVACLSGGTSYDTASGVSISIVANYQTNKCELELTQTGSISLNAPIANIPMGDIDNPCPSPSGTFIGFDTYGNAVFFEFVCAHCGYCPQVPVVGCCEALVPRVLFADVDGGVDCPCGTIVPLIYDDVLDVWTGTQPNGFCNHTITITLSCSAGNQWSILFSADPCVEDTATGSGTCDPVSLTFNLTSSGIGCCEAGVDKIVNITITVTE